MFVFGMGALGALLGCWIALSKSAVVITVLPLLFGVLGTAGGFSLWKLDIAKEVDQRKLKLIGSTLASISICCLVSMFGVLTARPSLERLYAPEQVEVSKTKNPLLAIMMREKLSKIGASDDEVRLIIGQLFDEEDDPAPSLERLRSAAQEMVREYASAAQSKDNALYTYAERYGLAKVVTTGSLAVKLGTPEFDKKRAQVLLRSVLLAQDTIAEVKKDVKFPGLFIAATNLDEAIATAQENSVRKADMDSLDGLVRVAVTTEPAIPPGWTIAIDRRPNQSPLM